MFCPGFQLRLRRSCDNRSLPRAAGIGTLIRLSAAFCLQPATLALPPAKPPPMIANRPPARRANAATPRFIAPAGDAS
jgi:hypothetical protein